MTVDGDGGSMQDDEVRAGVGDAPGSPEPPSAPATAMTSTPAEAPPNEAAPSDPSAPAETVAQGRPDGAAAPTGGRRPVATAMAAFERVPVRWLIVAAAAGLLLVIGLAAVLINAPSTPSAAPVQARGPGAGPTASAPGGTVSSPDAPSGSAPAPTGTNPGPGPGPGAGPGPAPTTATQPAAAPGPPPASVDALRALLIEAPGTDSTVDNEPIDDTTFAGARWGVSMFWAEPEGSLVLAQYSTPDQARDALSLYRESVHDSGICDEQPVAGRPDAFLCAAKGLGEGIAPGDIPAIGLAVKGTVVALVTASDPDNVQQLLVKQLDRLP
jgi:hypothetical protein